MKGFQTLAKVCAFGVVALSAGTAAAWQYYPGAAFKAAYASDASCFNVSSYSALVNNCTTTRLAIATVPMWTAGYHPTTVQIYGNNSWCETTTVNGVGNGAHLGTATYTVAGPMAWQTLNTGDRYVWEDFAIVFRCGLQSGGVIGGFTID
ncbi:hypothetical protein COCOR_01176 [Corallococcus coralloides DSM 2259]|uniref:Lipoprotein n=1 Tax=Corallococcus coralloides (strain ATCC 25202 / DSM 2259 / NBRC 100086 / M2) TaxID=1144275 RepID=H8MQJ1_CORCM|nr:hypothetical protein [Corallococcus coralloides]AFE03912.1 hypothetical protein COCOR_01176 [Corallococcus coralloides DSM 2259]